MDKKQLRKSIIESLKQKSESQKTYIESKLTHHLTQSSLWRKSNTIGITISKGFEWDTRPIIEKAWSEGKTVCVPKCEPREKELTFYKLSSYDQLEVVYYNLQEPKSDLTKVTDKQFIELLIVPGLLFDKQGFRIGFGGGYYDRFLTNFPNETISLCSTEQIAEEIPKEKFDIPVKHLITENGMIHV